MSPPLSSTVDLQSHLYMSFLEAKTADVALRIQFRGSWAATYKLHRVVLIQSGFFQSLFTAGFSEERKPADEMEIVFDDQNITRAAFEVCIARLYGGGPPLHISQSIKPTPSQPLTPNFPVPGPPDDTPSGHHPATPRFLLSLLATAVYLSIPSIASQALNAILGSVGPYTAVQYLSFALGHVVGNDSLSEEEGAIGLEHIAQTIQKGKQERPKLTPEPEPVQEHEAGELDRAFGSLNIKKETPSDSSLFSDPTCRNERTHQPSFHYGAVSNKIGEAAACWLARWAPDILAYEQKSAANKNLQTTLSEDTHYNSNASNSGSALALPVIWGRGGLHAKWVSALVASDALFVKGERERYEFARSVVELRRRDGLDEEEEEEWRDMFSQGIYYTNMAMEDVINISQDISTITGRPFVSLAILQAAHWNQSVLRHKITIQSSTSSPAGQSSHNKKKELGIALTTAEIFFKSSDAKQVDHTLERDKTYYPIPSDSSLRLGDNGAIDIGGSMDQLFEMSSRATDSNLPTPSEANFFGLASECRHSLSCISSDVTSESRWSPYPPFRFAVEFWDVDYLKEKCKLYSHTVWYAGSLFNIYVQVVRKKGIQLGVYVHRQSSLDQIPPSSAPFNSAGDEHAIRTRGTSIQPPLATSPSTPSLHYSPSIHPQSRSTTPVSASTSATNSIPGSTTQISRPSSIPATAPPITPSQPYRDQRPSIAAYFTISCASATGSSLTRFTSSPDVFAVSQSWGWKSSSLRTEEYLDVGADGQRTSHGSSGVVGKEVSLRATVILGVV